MEKKGWCCANAGKGCPGQSTSPAMYDCAAGFASWQTQWSVAQSTWCCAHTGKGCATATVSTSSSTQAPPNPPFDCAAGFANWQAEWSEGQKRWCCQSTGKGCPTTTSTTTTAPSTTPCAPGQNCPPPSTTASDITFDCAAGYAGWQTGWSEEKKQWCCQKTGKGCGGPDPCETMCDYQGRSASCRFRINFIANISKEPNPCQAAHAMVLAHCQACADCTAAKVPCPPVEEHHDCNAGWMDWKTAWTAAKISWCCSKTGKACEGTGSTSTPATTTPASLSTSRGGGGGSMPFDCALGGRRWSAAQQAWCCANYKICKEPDEPAPYVGPLPPVRPTSGPPGQPDRSYGSMPYDCALGADKWRSWPQHQQAWCCANYRVACDQKGAPGPSPPQPPALAGTTPKAPAGPSPPQPPAAAPGPSPTQPPAAAGPSPPQPPAEAAGQPAGPEFDCKQGAQDSHRLWAAAQKAWCCKTEHVGCEDTGQYHCDTLTPSSPVSDKTWCCAFRNTGSACQETIKSANELTALLLAGVGSWVTAHKAEPAKVLGDVDKDGDGHLSKDEFGVLLTNCQASLGQEALEVVFANLDVSGQGKISKDTFQKKVLEVTEVRMLGAKFEQRGGAGSAAAGVSAWALGAASAGLLVTFVACTAGIRVGRPRALATPEPRCPPEVSLLEDSARALAVEGEASVALSPSRWRSRTLQGGARYAPLLQMDFALGLD